MSVMSTKTDNDAIRHRRGGRLVRRARSFKQELFEKLNQIRSPSATRSASPNKGCGHHKHYNKIRNSKGEPIASKVSTHGLQPYDSKKSSKNKSEKDVNNAIQFVKQLTSALRYFQDVVEKDKLEQLAGSASILLEIVLNGYSELKVYLINNEQSSLVISATNQVYQSLANLIRWSDTVLLTSDKSLDKESVGEIAKSVYEAVHSLVQICIDRYQNKESVVKSDPNKNITPNGSSCQSSNTLNRLTSRKPDSIVIPALNSSLTNSSSHRSSLPEIPLSPREKEILESTNFATPPPVPFSAGFIEHLNHSLSSDSVLNTSFDAFCCSGEAPPKPPLPIIEGRPLSVSEMFPFDPQMVCPPPLPPKRYPRKGMAPQTSSFDCSQCESNCMSNCDSIDSCLNYSGFNHLSADDLLSITRSETKLDFKEHRSRYDSFTAITSNNHENGSAFVSKRSGHRSYEYKSYSQTRTTHRVYMNNNSIDFSNSPLTTPTFNTNRIDSLIDKMKAFNTSIEGEDCVDGGPPPKLPVKMRPKLSITSIQSNPNSTQNRPPSQYDNISNDYTVESPTSSQLGLDSGHELMQWHSNNNCKNHVNTCPHSTSCPHFMNNMSDFNKIDSNDLNNIPPPLPPKKRNIMAYMQMVGSYNGPVDAEFYRHSVHNYQMVQNQNQWQQTVELSFVQQRSITTSFVSASSDDSVFSYESEASLTPPPLLPPKKKKAIAAPPNKTPNSPEMQPRTSTPVSLVPSSESGISSQSELTRVEPEELQQLSALDEIDVSSYIITKNPSEEGPEIRGGTIDSLIVKATEVSKNDFMFQEAFLTTYRTLLTPMELINKLLYRYNKFILMSDMRQRAARNAFALLVRVVDDMCIGDCNDIVVQNLMDFIYQLVNRGDLALAKVLRAKCIEKMEQREAASHASHILLPSISVTIKQSSLIDFKSEHLAEQMTLLDSKLFLKIEIPEVLVWAKEQKEELIPNLNTFTEHFNKMSYWTRSRILECEEAKDRERLVMKFIKIMKHLRKLNNFNSYLAILSALDSAPIRRLEWQRSITEGLKEYSALIDSSSSFRAYRQALADTEPPCIPYIGLILQDLTFVHIGNNDFLPDGNINFAKRWQQYNILDQMRRFKNCHYPFKRNEQIIAFFNNFDNYLSEEAMWQISESIKPRGVTKK